jgi:hypothetical protein
MRPRSFYPVALLVSFLLAWTHPASGWGVGGHKIIALIAFDRMTEEARGKVIAILESHPRFQEDFARDMPGAVTQGSVRDRHQWLFTEAAIWPDRVRDFQGDLQTAYHRPAWHYINTPIFLDAHARAVMDGHLKANVAGSWSPTMDQNKMNAVQVLDMISRRYSSGRETKSDLAVLLCWAIHLVGDLHQPEHCVALFSPGQFPDLQSGDQGGNLVLVRFSRAGPPMRLHGFWDGLLGGNDTLNGLRRRAFDITRNQAAAAHAERSVELMNPSTWAAEGAANARAYVYTPELLGQVVQATPDHYKRIGPLTLPPSYREQAGGMAQYAAAAAGYRLASLLNQLMSR